MLVALQDYFLHYLDSALIVQMLSLSVSTVLLLGVLPKEKIRILPFALEVLIFSVVIFFIHMCVTVSSYMMKPFGLVADFAYIFSILLYMFVRGKHSWSNRIAMASVVFSLCTLMAALGTLLGNAIELEVQGFDIIWTKLFSYFLVVGCAVVFYKNALFQFQTNIFDALLNIVCNISSATLLIVWEYYRRGSWELMQSSWKFAGFISVMIIALLIINIATYFITYYLCKERMIVLEYQGKEQKKESLKELLQLSEHKIAELREVRHDVKNQYAYMQVLLDQKRYQELKEYFAELTGTIAKPLYEEVNSGNVMVDSVLNLALAKAKERGVKVNMKVAIPSELPFSQSGILALFTNVIDNAVEACVYEKIDNPSIDVIINTHEDYLLFSVSNPTIKPDMKDADGCLFTTKKNRDRHGYGMKIIRHQVKRYNGIYHSYIKNGVFVSQSMLDLNYKDKEE